MEGTNLVNMHTTIKQNIVLNQFWEIENKPDVIKRQLTIEEELCEEKVKSTT